MTAIVLAGGRSRRLGRNKALEKFGSGVLIQRVIDSVAQLDNDIVIVAASKGQLPQIDDRVRIVTDCYAVGGALVGIYTGLTAAKSQYSVTVACDMPFLNVEFFRYLISVSQGYDAVIPRIGTMIEPLHAVYSQTCLDTVKSQIESGNLKISDLLSELNVRYVEREEVERYDPQHLSFMNINSEEDLKKARAMMEKARR